MKHCFFIGFICLSLFHNLSVQAAMNNELGAFTTPLQLVRRYVAKRGQDSFEMVFPGRWIQPDSSFAFRVCTRIKDHVPDVKWSCAPRDPEMAVSFLNHIENVTRDSLFCKIMDPKKRTLGDCGQISSTFPQQPGGAMDRSMNFEMNTHSSSSRSELVLPAFFTSTETSKSFAIVHFWTIRKQDIRSTNPRMFLCTASLLQPKKVFLRSSGNGSKELMANHLGYGCYELSGATFTSETHYSVVVENWVGLENESDFKTEIQLEF